jgi:hypothetical protein
VLRDNFSRRAAWSDDAIHKNARINIKQRKGRQAMKHAGENSLNALEEMLISLRTCQGLKEKQRGIFYRKSKAFLHFHEDPLGLFADLRMGEDWVRFPVNTVVERETLLAQAINILPIDEV